MRAAVLALVVLSVSACKKADESTPAATGSGSAQTAPAAAAAAPAGPRVVAIEAGKEGYVPDKIKAKPGEQLKLVFTRTVDAECLAQVKTPDGVVHELPMNKPLEFVFTMPKEGKATFACGMDMFTGEIVADVN